MRDSDIDRLGPAIERGLDAAARRRAGQHFTSADVADLINAFCIRSADDRILDPACGTGAFLLRARARLRHLAGGRRVLPGAARLAGVETDRRLAAAAKLNVPEARIAHADFLAPGRNRIAGAGHFDAVVGNPPYVRQEALGAPRKLALETQAALAPLRLSPRCDLHVYFWPRAIALLRDGGRLGFVTSNTWLDAVYGEPLRSWLSGSFSIVAVIESQIESWFDDARVRTVVAIVEKGSPAGRSPARLVRLTRRLDEMAPPDLAPAERMRRFERIARRIEAGQAPDAPGRIRSVAGAALTGAPWGPILRMPDLYFEILSRAGDRLVPLSEVADVSWGIKTGDDAIFFARDGDRVDVEPRFLVPAVFNLMELDRVVVTRDQIRRLLLLVDLNEEGSRWSRTAPRLARYLRRAERSRATHLRPTCAAREKRGARPRRWFELRPGPPGHILWSIMHQYRHLAPWNPRGFPSNDNLLKIRVRAGVEPRLLAALLNSHVTALIKQAHGRHRNEGMLKTQAADIKRMPVPDPRRIDARATARLLEAFDAIAARTVGKIPDECALPDRRALDQAVLLALGYSGDEAGPTTGRLHEALIGACRCERHWEVDAVTRRRRGRFHSVDSASEPPLECAT